MIIVEKTTAGNVKVVSAELARKSAYFGSERVLLTSPRYLYLMTNASTEYQNNKETLILHGAFAVHEASLC